MAQWGDSFFKTTAPAHTSTTWGAAACVKQLKEKFNAGSLDSAWEFYGHLCVTDTRGSIPTELFCIGVCRCIRLDSMAAAWHARSRVLGLLHILGYREKVAASTACAVMVKPISTSGWTCMFIVSCAERGAQKRGHDMKLRR